MMQETTTPTPAEPMTTDAALEAIELARAFAAALPAHGLEESDIRRALVNWRLHRGAHRRGGRARCTKCVRTSVRLLQAGGM